MSAPLDLLRRASGSESPRILVIHAHPDDETVQTGGLMAHLCAHRAAPVLLTCTRGEQGESRPGVLPVATTHAEFVAARGRELAAACAALGITERYLLGKAPARVSDAAERAYRDSGMRWVSEGVAGPGDSSDPDTFTASDLEDEVKDALALISSVAPDVILGYDRSGSYGHPDHVRAHFLAAEAAGRAGLPLVEIASDDDAAGFTWFSLPETRSTVVAALAAHATQLSVEDGEIVHVGGQHQQLPLRVGLRVVSGAAS